MGVSKVSANTLFIELFTPEESYFGNQAPALSKLCKNGTYRILIGSDRYFLEDDYPTLAKVISEHIERN